MSDEEINALFELLKQADTLTRHNCLVLCLKYWPSEYREIMESAGFDVTRRCYEWP